MPNLQPIPGVRRVALITVFFTGFSGLVYEVTWQKYLANLIGSEAKSTSLVLAVFLGGLAAGYLAFGRATRGQTSGRLLKLCGLAEIGIGLWALLFPSFYEALWSRVGVLNPLSPWSTLVELALAIALLGVPTALMGCTLPLLTQAISRSDGETASIHARIYAWNTVGAFTGCLAAGFVLLPSLGLPITSMNMAFVNLLCGGLLVALGGSPALAAPATHAPEASPPSGPPRALPPEASLIALLAGFGGLALQTVLIRVAGLSIGASEYTFSMIVSLYVLMLAVGAGTIAPSPRASRSLLRNQLRLAAGLVILYLAVPHLPYGTLLVRTLFTTVKPAFYAYYLALLMLLGLMLALALLATGRLMPLLFATLDPSQDRAGLEVGKLYGWNAVGCVLGALVGGHVLLHWVNLDTILRLCILISGLAMIPMLRLIDDERRILYMAIAAGGAVAVAGLLPSWPAENLAIGLFRNQAPYPGLYDGPAAARYYVGLRKVIERRDDPNTSVSVLESPGQAVNGVSTNRALVVNGKSDGSTGLGDATTTRLLAHLPMLLGKGTRGKAAVVGFGTGITVGALSLYPELERIDCIEISPAVREFAEHFAFMNHDAARNPRVQWRIADAYRFLAATTDRYELIVSEPSNPWVGGVERLYTSEFYRRAAQSLSTGGVFAQWFHIYSISPETLAMVLRTFATGFKHVRAFSLPVSSDLILLGSDLPLGETALPELATRIDRNPEVKRELAEIGFQTVAQVLALEFPFFPAVYAEAAIHRLEFPKLSYEAGSDFFANAFVDPRRAGSEESARLWTAVWNKSRLLAHWLARNPELRGPALRDAARNHCRTPGSELCRTSSQLLSVAKLSGAPDSTRETVRIRGLVGTEPALPRPRDPAQALAEASALVQDFERFQSPYLPLSVERLLIGTKPCLESTDAVALTCRTKLAEVLAGQARFGDAREVVRAIRQTEASGAKLPGGFSARLEAFVQDAERVFASATSP